MDRHAADTRAVPGPGARRIGAAVAAAGRGDGPAAAVRAERGARGRGDAPGRQAEQRAARQRRPGGADRLRHRHLPGRPQAHPDRHGNGLARVHRTRADPRRGRVPRLRPVVARRDRLRGGRGPRPLREARRRHHHHVRHHQRGGARGAHGGRARPGHRRAAPPRARGPPGRERGRADDHRRAAAADRPDSGHVGRLPAHRALRVVPADPAPTGVSAGRIGAARVGTARIGAARVGTARIGAARVGTARVGTARVGTARVGTARVGTARVGTAAGVSAGRDRAGFPLGRADDDQGAGRGHRTSSRHPGVGRADRPDRAPAGPGRVRGPGGGPAARFLLLVRPLAQVGGIAARLRLGLPAAAGYGPPPVGYGPAAWSGAASQAPGAWPDAGSQAPGPQQAPGTAAGTGLGAVVRRRARAAPAPTVRPGVEGRRCGAGDHRRGGRGRHRHPAAPESFRLAAGPDVGHGFGVRVRRHAPVR